MKLLIDMNLSPKWVIALELAGFEAVHWSAVGLANSSDPEIMHYAKVTGFVVLTNDLDFGAILAATGGDAPSVIQLRTEDCRVGSIGDLVIDSIRQAEAQLTAGALVTIETSKLRITGLPIGNRAYLRWNGGRIADGAGGTDGEAGLGGSVS